MNSDKPTISALIITYNEVNNIKKVIDTVAFADEIIVVDSFSTDGTYKKLNEDLRITVFQKEFQDFADQRNYAIEKASMDWILFVDADEEIPISLKEEILHTTRNQLHITAYKIPRKFIFQNKIMHYSGLQTDFALRLFKRGTANYDPMIKVHEQLKVQGTISKLKNFMLHYTFDDYESYKAKTEHYARIKALELYQQNKRPTWIDLHLKPAYKFYYNYIVRLGFLDGKAGYTICHLNAHGVKHRYEVLKQLFISSPEQ